MTALSQTADDYVRLRRALGHKLADVCRLLPRLVAYLESIGLETITIEWTSPRGANSPENSKLSRSH
jgi:hypothetical protein